jgi:hypothetical protein
VDPGMSTLQAMLLNVERHDLTFHVASVRYHAQRLEELAVGRASSIHFAREADKIIRQINRLETQWIMLLDDLEAENVE